ncbi:hypothetical protein SCHPADRAFT_944596 [Schizopora paradoxa]|uniref:Mediator of RNA polymerase II transcription subunit 17 n=1 Tax=Schizopora paradoxa TaxID=27342 RepID=A0A0H2RA66_9AGAM|nr:hypothetical protein SCHPADRAFT_944596 [Schizopora paradoxa]
MAELSWRETRLSLERPYKDDNDNPIPTLLDIAPDGTFAYEPEEEWDAKLGQRFRRIFAERGIDFFERYDLHDGALDKVPPQTIPSTTDEKQGEVQGDPTDGLSDSKLMTVEMLFRMRSEIIPRLHIAYGEMSQARDLLSLLLSTSSSSDPSSVPLPSGSLTASSVSKLPAISSVQSFNARLVTGGKDEALRKASDVLKAAAEGVERGSAKSDKFWTDALSIRKSNWGLIPAPLPLGSAMGKGADKTSKDFLVSFGLEQSPVVFRRRAIAHMPFYKTGDEDENIVFPHRSKTRLRISLSKVCDGDLKITSHSQVRESPEDELNEAISAAQRELVEQEIFEEVIKEAADLPTASARVSERLVVVDAAQGVELRFELVDCDAIESYNDSAKSASDDVGQATCDLVCSLLHVLLLRAHAHTKQGRLSGITRAGSNQRPVPTPYVLRPVVEMLQYHAFCDRIRHVLASGVQALRAIGVDVALRFDAIGENGSQVIASLLEDTRSKLGGEAILRIDQKHSIRFSFSSPSSLVAHLPQATITIISVPQLRQLLVDEFERRLLGRICSIGTDLCENINGTWFVDEMMCRSVGRWEGCAL